MTQTVLVVGASGATGRLLVGQLLDRGHAVRLVVRSAQRLPAEIARHENVLVVEAAILDLPDDELLRLVDGCDAVASCLGHNLSFRGLFGPPRRLVTDATRRLCDAVRRCRPRRPVRFVLMNTTGNRNRDLQESVSFAQACVIGLLRHLLPPHADNEEAADFLRVEVGQDDPVLEWVVVRPDTLSNDATVTAYSVHASPTRSAIFDAGTTSRINVGHFMAELIANDEAWSRWRGAMPVIYNDDSPAQITRSG